MMAVATGEAALYEPEHRDFRDSARTFLAREAVPAYPGWRSERAIPRDLLRIAGEHGFLGMRVPEEHGGAGADDLRFGVIVAEEAMLAATPALALVLSSHNDVALPAILRGAAKESRAEHLPRLASGASVASVIPSGLELDGDAGDPRLHGEASMVVNGAHADLFVALARSEDGERAVALVSCDADGVEVEASESPVGLDAAGLATVRLDGAPGLLLEDRAEEVEIDQALALAVTALAGTRAALATTIAYVSDRRAFGQPISAFQNTRRMLAGVSTEIEVADAFVERVVRRRICGELDHETAAAGKLFCTELYGRAVDAGLHLHGGYGYIMEYEIAHAYADARFWRLAGMPSQRAADAIGGALLS